MANDAETKGNWVKSLIHDFIDTSADNTMQNESGDPAWDAALVGFASGADPIWQQYKEYIGAFHWTPWEVFNQHQPEERVSAEELTVVSWVLPQREMVRKSNRRARKFPSEEWARIRIYGEAFNVALRHHVVSKLEEAGHPVLPPPFGEPSADGLLRLLALNPDIPPLDTPGRWEPDYLRASGAARMWKTRKGLGL